MSIRTSSVAAAVEVSDWLLDDFTTVAVYRAASSDTPMSRSFLFGVLIQVSITVVQLLLVDGATSETLEATAVNFEEELCANAPALPAHTIATTATITAIDLFVKA